MSRVKKTRKTGKLSDPHKAERESPRTSFRQEQGKALKKAKKRKGLASGGRNTEDPSKAGSGKSRQIKDDIRLGSKKPVALGVEKEKNLKPQVKPATEKVTETVKANLTPEQELEKLENDTRLQGLLERAELGDTLTKKEQAWLDEKLDRYQHLMEELGLDEEEDELDELSRSADWLNELKNS